MANVNWQPNEKQKLFLEALKDADGKSLTLAEISSIVGQEIKSGSINTLITKGLVETEKITYECDIVRKDTKDIIGSTKKQISAYKLKVQA